MFRDVISRSTSLEEWRAIRAEVRNRILSSMGSFPGLSFTGNYELLNDYQAHGVRILKIRFEAIPDHMTYGVLVLPSDFNPKERRPAVLCCHETARELGYRNVISPDITPNRAYGIELAQRGYVTLAVDLIGFGESNGQRKPAEVEGWFYSKYPDWSLDGARVWIQQCALDVAEKFEGVNAARFGCIGNSLGGRTVVYTAAFDERIKAAVASTGVSPNLTNVYRGRPGSYSPSPRLGAEMARCGIPSFEYQELLALIAPRAVLLIEPWNDAVGCNPLIEANFRCFEKARFVFELCGASPNLNLLCHGDGHDTTSIVRQYAYLWLAEHLK
jgi:pimeloyl-ACP methyl ester carboxylesterase